MKEKKMKKSLLQKGSLNTIGLSMPDPLGSYTGRPYDPNEVPVQDVDDL